ncbi:hypothetical protein BJY04DRAFT_201831, partial [Aspergillus karnatakaensis]|uniref:uncharacterized protein n=1 Tax=Aspergillus karnatakaensis TaxID=1810916 RepID=UPI003CCDAFA6
MELKLKLEPEPELDWRAAGRKDGGEGTTHFSRLMLSSLQNSPERGSRVHHPPAIHRAVSYCTALYSRLRAQSVMPQGILETVAKPENGIGRGCSAEGSRTRWVSLVHRAWICMYLHLLLCVICAGWVASLALAWHERVGGWEGRL